MLFKFLVNIVLMIFNMIFISYNKDAILNKIIWFNKYKEWRDRFMEFDVMCKEKLSKLLFLEIDGDKFIKMLGGDSKNLEIKELYIPINPKYISKDVESGYNLDKLPMNYLIEGMFFALGADENLKFNNEYKKILSLIKDAILCIKSIISDKIKEESLIDALILLKGLSEVVKDEEVYSKLLLLCESIREKNKNYNSLQLDLSERYKEACPKSAMPYIYASLAYNDLENYDKAYLEINEYLSKGGEKTEEVKVLYDEIKDSLDYEKGKEELLEEPEVALRRLLPLSDKFPENAIIKYYIATAYRRLENFEKAIYYLNESTALDNNMVEPINELGINYAYLGDYENALKFFRKAFEATRDIEICTNIIMCYLNLNNLEEAKKHLNIAKAINKDDEVLRDIERYMENLSKQS